MLYGMHSMVYLVFIVIGISSAYYYFYLYLKNENIRVEFNTNAQTTIYEKYEWQVSKK